MPSARKMSNEQPLWDSNGQPRPAPAALPEQINSWRDQQTVAIETLIGQLVASRAQLIGTAARAQQLLTAQEHLTASLRQASAIITVALERKAGGGNGQSVDR